MRSAGTIGRGANAGPPAGKGREGPVPDPADRRHRQRLPLPGTLTGSMGLESIRVLNLSSMGAMIEHLNRLTPGQPCRLGLRLAGRDLDLSASVVWSALDRIEEGPEGERECYRSGLFFADLPEGVGTHLQQYLTTLGR